MEVNMCRRGREEGREGETAINTYGGGGVGSAPTAQIRRRKISSRQKRCEVVEGVWWRRAAAAEEA